MINTNELRENSNKYRRVKQGLFGSNTGRIKTFAVISPCNPNSEQLSNEENKKLIQSFKDTCSRGRIPFVKIHGKFGNDEISFFLTNITIRTATALATEYDQQSFFFGNVQKVGESENANAVVEYWEKENIKSGKYVLKDKSNRITDASDFVDFFSNYSDIKWSFDMDIFNEALNSLPEIFDEQSLNDSLDDSKTGFYQLRMRARAYGNKANKQSPMTTNESINEDTVVGGNLFGQPINAIGNGYEKYTSDYDKKLIGKQIIVIDRDVPLLYNKKLTITDANTTTYGTYINCDLPDGGYIRFNYDRDLGKSFLMPTTIKDNKKIKEDMSSSNFTYTTIGDMIAGSIDNMSGKELDRDLAMYNRIGKTFGKQYPNEVVVYIDGDGEYNPKYSNNSTLMNSKRGLDTYNFIGGDIGDEFTFCANELNGNIYLFFETEEDADRYLGSFEDYSFEEDSTI